MQGRAGRRSAAALVLLALHAGFGLVRAPWAVENDFANYYVPARMIREGRSLDRIYERDAFQAEVRRAGIGKLASFVPQPPANALLLVPLASLSPGAAKAAWTGLLAAAYAGAFLVLRALVPSGWLVFAFLLPTASLHNSLRYGQPYPLLLLLLSLALLALARGRQAVSGLLLGLVLALKLYALPFLVFLLWSRRFKAALGLAAGTALVSGASLALVGPTAHEAYLREVLEPSLAGTIQDPYSPIWGSLASLSHRLFQAEPDLNPAPAVELPALALVVPRAVSACLLGLAVLARRPGDAAAALMRQWAILALAALAVSPLTGSYHFVLLVLPVALLVAGEASALRRAACLALLAFASSSLPHHFAPLAAGWGNLLAYPRLLAVLGLLGLSLRGAVRRSAVLASLAAGVLAGVTAWPAREDPGWTRIGEARGYLCAEPVWCGGGLAWLAIGEDRLVVRTPGPTLRGEGDLFAPRCAGGRVVAASEPSANDEDRDQRGEVVADDLGVRERDASGRARVLAAGRARWPRISPDGRWVAYQSFEDGSWDVRVVERSSGRSLRLTHDPTNELEPAWRPAGDAVLFASDRRRGLGSTALYEVSFRP